MIPSSLPPDQLKRSLQHWAEALGFDQVRIGQPDLEPAGEHLKAWLEAGCHGHMDFMERHAHLRRHPEQLLPGTLRIISVSLSYLAESPESAATALENPSMGYVSRYALGRDYHKVVRNRLQKLASRLEQEWGPHGYRVFCDSAPVMEVEIAHQAGLGWRGKNTLLLNRDRGSFFFLGEIYTDLPLPVDDQTDEHCGSCRACLDVCPTGALPSPYRLDARLCISYLTIEHKGAIPEHLRPKMGNRIYGCDDCQLVCPWNRFAQLSRLPDFAPRTPLRNRPLTELFAWSEADFLAHTSGTAIRRIGHERWLRNVAIALGNGPAHQEALQALMNRQQHPSELVREHVNWALSQLSE